MSTATLTSLAILKVSADHRRDYLDYLWPFILQVLHDHRPEPISGHVVSNYIREGFGLEIPDRTINIVLKRIARRYSIKKEHGVYRIVGDLPDPRLWQKKERAQRHISSVLQGLRRFSTGTINSIDNDHDAIDAICAFLAEFDVSCLRAYLRGTAIPSLEGRHQTDIVLVSDYVRYVQQANPERFDSFLILVQGHMLANALLCPDLQDAPATYRDVTFYFDTPLLVQQLGLDGKPQKDAINALVNLLARLGGRAAAFAHSRDELQRLVQRTAEYFDTPQGRGGIVFEARRRGTTRSDLILIAESIDAELEKVGIKVDSTPPYIEDYQIDEQLFEEILEEKVRYRHNPNAKRHDTNSVRSIYALRANRVVRSLERAKAIFVTSNTGFAQAAWEYDQRFEPSQKVSSVISDFSLANMAWLKAPMGAPQIPTTQLLAFSYAALEPSEEFLDKYMSEIDRLERKGEISVTNHQLLRSSINAIPEIMHLTLGEDRSLTKETIVQTLERVSSEIKQEETDKLLNEQEAHRTTRQALDTQKTQNAELKSNIYWRCRGTATKLARSVSIAFGVLLAISSGVGIGLLNVAWVPAWILICSSVLFASLTLANLIFGTTVSRISEWVQALCLTWLLKREENTLGVTLNEFDTE